LKIFGYPQRRIGDFNLDLAHDAAGNFGQARAASGGKFCPAGGGTRLAAAPERRSLHTPPPDCVVGAQQRNFNWLFCPVLFD
jgi:hypothetical protein